MFLEYNMMGAKHKWLILLQSGNFKIPVFQTSHNFVHLSLTPWIENGPIMSWLHEIVQLLVYCSSQARSIAITVPRGIIIA